MGIFFKNQDEDIEDTVNKSAESVKEALSNDKWLLNLDGSKTSLEPPLTNRDKIAIKAMIAIIKKSKGNDAHYPEQLSQWSYSIADAMLKQREL